MVVSEGPCGSIVGRNRPVCKDTIHGLATGNVSMVRVPAVVADAVSHINSLAIAEMVTWTWNIPGDTGNGEESYRQRENKNDRKNPCESQPPKPPPKP